MRVTVAAPLVHRCPFVDEVDVGSVEASWEGDAVELHGMAGYFASWTDERISHEELTERTAEWIRQQGATAVAVVTRWVTGGLAVRVEATRP